MSERGWLRGFGYLGTGVVVARACGLKMSVAYVCVCACVVVVCGVCMCECPNARRSRFQRFKKEWRKKNEPTGSVKKVNVRRLVEPGMGKGMYKAEKTARTGLGRERRAPKRRRGAGGNSWAEDRKKRADEMQLICAIY